MRLPYSRENLVMMFGGKAGELVLTKAIKKKFRLVKKSRSYAITSISNLVVKVATQRLAGKVMWKFHFDEVPSPVVALAAQMHGGSSV